MGPLQRLEKVFTSAVGTQDLTRICLLLRRAVSVLKAHEGFESQVRFMEESLTGQDVSRQVEALNLFYFQTKDQFTGEWIRSLKRGRFRDTFYLLASHSASPPSLEESSPSWLPIKYPKWMSTNPRERFYFDMTRGHTLFREALDGTQVTRREEITLIEEAELKRIGINGLFPHWQSNDFLVVDRINMAEFEKILEQWRSGSMTWKMLNHLHAMKFPVKRGVQGVMRQEGQIYLQLEDGRRRPLQTNERLIRPCAFSRQGARESLLVIHYQPDQKPTVSLIQSLLAQNPQIKVVVMQGPGLDLLVVAALDNGGIVYQKLPEDTVDFMRTIFNKFEGKDSESPVRFEEELEGVVSHPMVEEPSASHEVKIEFARATAGTIQVQPKEIGPRATDPTAPLEVNKIEKVKVAVGIAYAKTGPLPAILSNASDVSQRPHPSKSEQSAFNLFWQRVIFTVPLLVLELRLAFIRREIKKFGKAGKKEPLELLTERHQRLAKLRGNLEEKVTHKKKNKPYLESLRVRIQRWWRQ